jgi:2,3,4,5-tetrahydropyridine-2,6-dicarboxylate N-succinyltransferase
LKLSALKAHQLLIESAYTQIQKLTSESCSESLKKAVHAVIEGLDQGALRVAMPVAGGWEVQQWLKKAILLYFRIQPMSRIEGGASHYYDKVPLKYADYQSEDFAAQGARVVPQAVVRRGAFIGKDVVLMPSYVNIGAYVGEGSMIDTWATVGSCAQIGKGVHLSGGAGIGGVLEPLGAQPTIVEDGCFIGARAEIVEGVVIGAGSVIAMGTFIGQSTKVLDAATGEVHRGAVPPGSVVVPGSMPSKQGSHHLGCAVIVKKVDAQTRSKTSINQLLREAVVD